MQAQLRPFDTSDTVALLDLLRDTVNSVVAKDYSQEVLVALAPPFPDVKKKQSKFKSTKTVVAHIDGKPVGFANLDNSLTAIGSLYVHKDHLRQKIGSRLLKSLEKKLIKRGLTKAVADVSITSKSFFEKRGYQKVKENHKMINGVDFLTYTMEKDLSEEKPDMKEKSETKEKLKETSSFSWKDLFINKFFDLLMVIIGVSAAFQLEKIKIASDHESMERFYIESMLGDLRRDKEKMLEVVASLNEDHNALENYISLERSGSYPVDSLGYVLLKVMSLETFSDNQNTYEMLKSNNGLTEFSDPDLRTKTTDYYNRYTSLRRFEEIYTTILFSLNNYFTSYIDFAQQKVLDPSIASKPATKNWLLLTDAQLHDGLADYKEAMEKLDVLIEACETRLLELSR